MSIPQMAQITKNTAYNKTIPPAIQTDRFSSLFFAECIQNTKYALILCNIYGILIV